MLSKNPAVLRQDAAGWRIQSEAYRIAADIAEDKAAKIEREAAQTDEDRMCQTIRESVGSWVRVLYQGEKDTRAHWRIVRITTPPIRAQRHTQAERALYFVGYCAASDEPRNFRVERVEDIGPILGA